MYERKCKICGKEFTATHPAEMICSDECRREQNRIKSRLYKRKQAEKNITK